MISIHDGCAECCLIWNVYDITVVTLKLRKQYLNTVTYNTPVLLWIKT